MKRTGADWLRYIKMYTEKGIPMMEISKKYNFDVSNLKYRVRLYELYGEKPFTDLQGERIYTKEEKLEAIQKVLSGKISSRQLSLELGHPDPKILLDWIRLFKTKGPDGIHISRGRKKYLLHEDRQRYLADKELKERNTHLEIENEILKKSLALALKKDKRLRKRYKSFTSSGIDIN